MKFLSCEKISEHKYKTPEGYLICVDSILARTGKQTYRRSEVFGVDCKDADEEVEIDRNEKEVFSDKTLASFENKPLTVEHPNEDVNINNHNELSVGFVRDIKRGKVDGQDVMLGTLVITDAQTIEEIENGEHTDLSCGYDCDIVDEDNPQQRNIRGNHVALCQQGRAGIARIVDSKSVKDNIQFVEKWTSQNGDKYDIWKDNTGEYYVALSKSGKKLARIGAKSLDRAKQILQQEDLFDDSIKDSYLSEEEKELIDYVIENLDHHGNADEALRLMNSYYSMYQRLARHKPNEVKEYFNKHVDDSINDAGLKLFQVQQGYAIVAKKYYNQYKDNAFVDSVEDSLDSARYTKMSLERNDKIDFVIVDCTQADKKKVVDAINDDAAYDWQSALMDENIKFDFIKGGYGMKFKSQKDYNRAKELAKKYRMTKGHWYDKDLEYFDYGSTTISNDSIKDKLVDIPNDLIALFERLLKTWKINIDSQGKTWSGRLHYQVSSNVSWNDFKTALHSIEQQIEAKGIPMTFSANTDGLKCTAGIDLDKMYVKDSINDAPDLSGLYKNANSDAIKVTRNGFSYDVRFGEDTIFNKGWSVQQSYDSTHLLRYIRQNQYTKVSKFDYLKDSIKDDSNTYKEVTKNLKKEAEKEMKDDNEFYLKIMYTSQARKGNELYRVIKGIDKRDCWSKFKKAVPSFTNGKFVGEQEISKIDYDNAPQNLKIADALKQFKVKYKDSKGRQVTYLIKAKSLADAIKKIDDDRLAPMTYKKLKEFGVSKETYSKWTQEQANKYIKNRGQKGSEKTTEKKEETFEKSSKKIKSEIDSMWSKLNLTDWSKSKLIGTDLLDIDSRGAMLELNKRSETKALAKELHKFGLTSAEAVVGNYNRPYVRFDIDDIDNFRKKLNMPSIAQVHATKTQEAVADKIADDKIPLTESQRKGIDAILKKIKNKPISIHTGIVGKLTSEPKPYISLFKNGKNIKYDTFILPADNNFDKLRLSKYKGYQSDTASSTFPTVDNEISLDKLIESINNLS